MTSLVGILSTATYIPARVHSFVLPSVNLATHTAITTSSSTVLCCSTTTITTTTTASQPSLLVADAPVIVLKRSRQSKNFRNGNQLVFTKSIQSGTADMSALVRVCVLDDNNNGKKDNNNNKHSDKPTPKQQQAQPIGWGVYNPSSLYKVRMLCHRYVSTVKKPYGPTGTRKHLYSCGLLG